MITFNKNSWHCRMAKLYSKYDCPADSLCPYARQVMVGLFLFCLMTSVVGGFVIWNILGIILAFQGYWWIAETNFAHVANTLTLIIVFCLSFVLGMNYIQDEMKLRRRKKEEIARARDYQDIKPDSFIYVWFRNIHSKICPSIDFKD